MPAAPATLKTLCTASEWELIQASRPGQLGQHGAGELRRLVARSRKLCDKWQGLARAQARQTSRASGVGAAAPNSQLKADAFRQSLDRFSVRLAKLEPSDAGAKGSAPRPGKRAKSAGHRATRATTRKKLSLVEEGLNARSRRRPAVAKPALATPAPASTPAAQPPAPLAAAAAQAAPVPAKKARKSRSAPKAAPPARTVGLAAAARPPRAVKAKAAAKQARLVASGKTTRGRGHLAGSVKRSQARRDARK